MIREERLESTKEMIKKYSKSKSILKENYKHICGLIKDLELKNEQVFVSAFKIDYTVEELKQCKKMYSKALRTLKKIGR